jgi:hypothetical protein
LDTLTQYRQIVARLEKHGDDIVATYLSTALAPASARLYRSAILRLVPLSPDDKERLYRHTLRPTKKRGTSLRVRRFSISDTRALARELIVRQRKDAAIWLLATVAVGLRPCEWSRARFEENLLLVKNAKNSNGRSFGETRSLIVESDETRRIVALQLAQVAKCPTWRILHKSCCAAVHRAARALWPSRAKLPGIYTGRHVFCANAKLHFTKIEVAALMGHGSVESASRHYAPRWSGTGGRGVRPSSHDVELVRSRAAQSDTQSRNASPSQSRW